MDEGLIAQHSVPQTPLGDLAGTAVGHIRAKVGFEIQVWITSASSLDCFLVDIDVV